MELNGIKCVLFVFHLKMGSDVGEKPKEILVSGPLANDVLEDSLSDIHGNRPDTDAAGKVTEDSCSETESRSKHHPNRSDEKTNVHACDFPGCDKSFGKPSRLQQHRCLHTGERIFQCSHEGCTKSYTRAFHLRRHEQTAHVCKPYIRMLSCPVKGCLQQLKSEHTLRKHYHRFHERSGKFKCDQCDESFKKHSQLKSHIFEHTGVYPYICSCGSGFLSLRELKRHKPQHDIKYQCPVKDCQEYFSRWTELRKHKKLFHPREFKCSECGRVFWSKGNLRNHVQVHREQRPVFQCSWHECKRFYYHDRNLQHHVRCFHEGKTFTCTYADCTKKLSSKRKLLNHQKLHELSHSSKRPREGSNVRKPRKDAGKPRKSMAGKLAGVLLTHSEERLILKENIEECEISNEAKQTIVNCESILDVQVESIDDETAEVDVVDGSGSESNFMAIDWPSRIKFFSENDKLEKTLFVEMSGNDTDQKGS